MAAEVQKVVVIQDASKDIVSSSAIESVLQGLLLKPGDELTLLAVLHQVNNPSTLSFMAAGRLLGYRTKMDSSSIFGTNQKVVEEELERKAEEYRNKVGIIMISQQCERAKVEFNMEVIAGPSPKMVAVEAAIRLGASWVILDRSMKKDKQFFMEKLSCGISRMKRNNYVEQLRGPKPFGRSKQVNERRSKSVTKKRSKDRHVKYDEMIPGSPDEELSPKRSPSLRMTSSGKEQEGDGSGHPWPSHRKSTSSSETLLTTKMSSVGNTETLTSCLPCHYQEEESTTNTERGKAGEHSQFPIAESQARVQKETDNVGSSDEYKQHSYKDDWIGECQTDEEFKNSICTVCKNKRPTIGWKRDFTHAELLAATDGFSMKTYLSEGGFGSVYKGDLNGLKIAVKQHKNASCQGEKEFESEVHVLSKARHENLVMLLGSCSEGNHRLLVYEYVCNGSLDKHLSNHSRRPLSWDMKIKIATGAARGLQYLHANNIIHRDVRPNNILVTHDYESLARPLLKERNYPDLIDPSNVDCHDVHQLYWMVRVAEKCLSRDPHKRLTMDAVVNALNYLNDANPVCSIGDFSPAQSESAGSMPGSSESHGDHGDYITVEVTPTLEYMHRQSTSSETSSFSTVSEQSSLGSSASTEEKKENPE
ncbi:hypothetical protein GBA52_008615 [Prunus armeniaca]|nr:hypothetical protein GBA52_008615 [Prunus armeniaca]